VGITAEPKGSQQTTLKTIIEKETQCTNSWGYLKKLGLWQTNHIHSLSYNL